MKRVVTLIVVALMFASLGTYFGTARAEEKDLSTGRNAVYIAQRWAPVGYNWSANKLYEDRTRNFEIGGTYTGWGREDYRMPACTDNPVNGAVRTHDNNLEGPLYNIPATAATDVEPRFWCEFYLIVDPDGPKSQEYEHWFAMIDSGGNLWFDPDGYFNDSRYYAYADPLDIHYNQDDSSLFDSCQRNPNALVDPTTANNTQGPYPLLPTNENGDLNPGYVDNYRVTPFVTGTVQNPVQLPPSERLTGMGSTPMYFMEPKTNRVFRIGWVDMVDFPLIYRSADANNPRNRQLSWTDTTAMTVVGNTHREDVALTQASFWNIGQNEFWGHRYDDWDINHNLYRFRDAAGGDVGPNGPFWVNNSDANTGRRDQNGYAWLDDPIWDYGEEWHTDNVGFTAIPQNDPNQNNPARYQTYQPGEWIYRGGYNRSIYVRTAANRNFVIGYDPLIQVEDQGEGDERLTPVSVHVNLVTYNYAPSTCPRDRGQFSGTGQFGVWDPGDDYDIGQMDRTSATTGSPDPTNAPRPASPFRLSIANIGVPDPGVSPTQGDELHADNINNHTLGDIRLYDPYEHVYQKGYTDTTTTRVPNTLPRVQIGDNRLTNVNSNSHPWALQNYVSDQPNRLGGLWVGDVLILSEVLTAVCNDNDFYNLSVESDLWEGVIPSTTTAVLRSQLGEITERGQTINKSTVLGPTGTAFAVPATTFMDCYPRSRQYLGVEIFNDNGKDNNLGAQHYSDIVGTPPASDLLYPNNMSDDYRPGKTCEVFLGAQDPNPNLFSKPWFLGSTSDYYQRGLITKDIGRILTRFDNLAVPVRFLDTQPGGAGTTRLFGCGKGIYLDVNNDYEIGIGDKRLADITINRNAGIITYKAGSYVNAGDVDVNAFAGANNDLNDFRAILTNGQYHWPMFYDEYIIDPENSTRLLPPNGTYDPGEIIYDTNMPFNGLIDQGVVQPGFQRMTAGWIGDTWYDCGSIVPPFDFYLYTSVPYGVTSGLNCDSRYMDWEVIPGDIKLDVQIDKELMVEQTSDITVSVNPPPREGHWVDKGDHRLWIPDEAVYVLVRDPGGIAGGMSDTNINAQYRVLTPKSPKVTFTMTPYRGSCHPENFKLGRPQQDALKVRIQAFKANPEIGLFANRTLMADLMIVPPDQHPGYQSPITQNFFRQDTMHFYRDLFWTGDWKRMMNMIGSHGGNHWGKRFPRSGKKSPGLYLTDADNKGFDLAPAPPLPMTLSESYDCYGEKHFEVLPEQLKVDANVACITTLDQRFPNIMLTLSDIDNPNDVNDPYGVNISVPKTDSPLIAVYNGHGGGVNWLAVAELANPAVQGEKIIIQANIDGTYEYWYWYEPANTDPNLGPQVPNAIDANDVIIGQEWTTFPIQCTDKVKRTGVKVDDRASWDDADCSSATNIACRVNMPEGMKPIGDITGQWGNPLGSDHYGIIDGAFAWIVQYGVPTYVTPYGELTPSDPGGECLAVIHPKDGSTHLNIHVYLTNAIFDYNSTIAHPVTGSPYFRTDVPTGINQNNPGYINLGEAVNGIDYAGTLDLKVYPPDPYVNFAEWLIVDKALMYSNVNYTVASSTNPALSQLPPPAPQIQPPYWPILRTSHGGFRVYPGGQTHTGRVRGQNFNQNGGAFGWNAYPAIWSEEGKKNAKSEMFYKLGTEFFPLTDYGLYFILKDGEGNHLSFKSPTLDRTIKRIEIVGPFARPKVVDVTTNRVVNWYAYNGLQNVPIQYDYSGKIVIDETNWSYFEHIPGGNYMNWSALSDVDYGSNENIRIKRTGKLNYCSLDNVFVIDELIPWNSGKIFIYVTLADGTFKMYQDCCTAPPVDGIDVRALDLKQTEGDENYEPIDHITLDSGRNMIQKLSFTLKEYEPMQVEQLCNDAVMYIWQDRGVKDLRDTKSNLVVGAGDGWVTNPPTSSRAENYHTQYIPDNDVNGDNKIKFNDYETEICGTYDMVTNTWMGGIIDARTFQRNTGRYDFELSQATGANIDTVGLDFGGENGVADPQDHIISDNETLPVYITAYKYGDDNNDRSFGPWWDFDAYYSQYDASVGQYTRTRYSHEVYLAAQVALPVEPYDDLIVTYTPNPLTAGITPELVDVNSPLTFVVKNEKGDPVNLLDGIIDQWGKKDVDPKVGWNYLFKDPHPDNTYYYGRNSILPQYYFLRTDLHNYDGTDVNNRELYSSRGRDSSYDCKETILEAFEPITPDFSNAKSGLYIFRGFCANDNNIWMKDEDHPDRDQWEKEHLVRVYIYTPDRKHRGSVDVKVVNPHAEYSVVNMEDPQLRAFTVPGEPDFIMTAADNRIYKVTVTISNAQGQLVKGVTKGVSVCGGGVKNTARFTPFTTRPQSFDFRNQTCDYVPCSQVTYPHFGYDFVADGNITWQDQELYKAGGFTLRPINNKCWDRQGVGEVFYNTTNEYFRDDKTWRVINEGTAGQRVEVLNLLLPPPAFGWGLGAIYNWPYWGGFLFTDIDRNGSLDYHDALGLDVNAQTSFYLWAEDLFYVGGLVGDNVYCNTQVKADLVGYPPYSDKTNPRYMVKRFRHGVTNDTVFFMDWEAIPDKVAQVSYPRIELFYAENGNEVSKDLLNVDNYDMVYNYDNHFIARVYPAFKEDLPLKDDGRVYVSGNQAQQWIYGQTKKSEVDDMATETTFHYTPTGTGQSTTFISYLAKNKWYFADPYQLDNPEWYSLKKIYHLDVGKGLEVMIASDNLAPNAASELTIYVKELGTEAVVPEATVYVEGPGIQQTSLTTNAKGEVRVKVTPKSQGKIVVTAERDEYIAGSAWVMIGKDTIPPVLDVDPIAPYGNKTSIDVTGKTEPGVKLTVNGTSARVDDSGKFTVKITLKEGVNPIVVEAIDAAGNRSMRILSTIVDITPPAFIINGEVDGKILVAKDQTTIKLSGRVDPGSKVTVNGAPAKVVYDIWEVEITMDANLPELPLSFQFIDVADNQTTHEVKLVRQP
ncbi:MAG TPA: hypothetical protein PL190_00495 [Caldisericia bacterium]|nr:hypothetical protein [Caldisericia bacterium]HOC79678.1 hypothetical protein [Caldisericia bacterium]HOG70036.1 hypothetical protein [Caldisericia bacterium]HPA65004.1 hypothetical protein [Caldisericia bacterium]HQN36680.1 hypothetical protein [Caldisericia bacterium]